MPDLGKTDAQWLRYKGEEWGYAMLGPERLLWEILDRFRKTRTQVAVDGWQPWADLIDIANGGCTFTGVKYGVNCDVDGRVWVRGTGGSNPRTISVYKAAGGGSSDKVAEGSGNTGATITLTAQNGSGMGGTWRLPATFNADTSDELQLLLTKDFNAILLDVFDEQDSVEDDPITRKVFQDLYANIANQIQTALGLFSAAASLAFVTNPADKNTKARGSAFVGAQQSSLFQVTKENLGEDGGVSLSTSGLVPREENSMAAETTGSTQYVKERGPSAGSVSYGSQNAGSLDVTVGTIQDRCRAITVVGTCVRGSDNEDKASNFAFAVTITNDEDETSIANGEEAVVGQPWAHEEGVAFQVDLTLSKTGDGSNNIFTAATNASVTGATRSNTATFVLHWRKTETSSGVFKVEFFKDSSLDATYLVASKEGLAADEAFVASPKNVSGLSVSWQMGSTPGSSTDTGTLLLNPPKVDADGNGNPDTFEFSITVPAGAGLYQSGVKRITGGQLNSTTAGSETISDDYVKAGTFPDYAVQDN